MFILPSLFQSVYIMAFLFSSIIRCFWSNTILLYEVFATGTERIIVLTLTALIQSVILVSFLIYLKKSEKSSNTPRLLYISPVIPIFTIIYFIFSQFKEDTIGEPIGILSFFNINSDIIYVFGAIIVSLSCISTYLLLFEMWRKNKIEKEKELYRNMLTLEKKHYEDIKASSIQIRKIRHDIKNMLYSVKSELAVNNSIKANEKLDIILENVNSVGTVVKSENRMVDYIVNTKLSGLENSEIQVSGDASGLTQINDLDISIILGNLLDNSLEAIKNIDNAKIILNFFIKENCQNILCKNTISHSIIESNPNLETNKLEKSLHGFGIKSIRDTLLSYNGTMNIFEENNYFCVHIMLPIK